MSARKQLELRMKSDQFALTTKPYQSIVKTSFGYSGFIISHGVWYKLRVYDCRVYDDGDFTISDPDEYEDAEYDKLLKVVDTIKKQNK